MKITEKEINQIYKFAAELKPIVQEYLKTFNEKETISLICKDIKDKKLKIYIPKLLDGDHKFVKLYLELCLKHYRRTLKNDKKN